MEITVEDNNGNKYTFDITDDAKRSDVSSNDLLGSCVWSQEDEDSDGWETDCGHNFEIYEGMPADNNMKFCCYCGKRLNVELYQERTPRMSRNIGSIRLLCEI